MKSIILGLLVLSLISCKEDKRRADVQKIVSEWTGRQVLIPDDVPCVVAGGEADCVPLSGGAPYRILMYVDSVGCLSCNLRLPYWAAILAEADSLFPGKVDFLFFFQPKDQKELTYLLRRDGFRHPVFIDRENRLDRLNRFPAPTEYRCFLLDGDNRVVMVGNPALNPGVWELYKRQIGGTAAPEQETARTTVRPDTPEQNLGSMKTGETYACTFVLMNTGDRPLAITDIVTSCGCTTPSWSRQPVAPGKTVEIRVEVTPDAPGAFRKTLTVYGNMENAPLHLTIAGEVIN
ncbi:MAG: DUF1573 domain-containing protein [Tannerella sp.]|jgi:hypothetical protein|nr:DUF1573 domain-containing protein [Tannerella sp.]